MDQFSELKVGLSVTAITRQDRQIRSVELRRKGRSLELLHLEQAETWPVLARRIKVLDESGKRLRQAQHVVVAGLSSVGLAFYRMTLPKVGTQETEAMVRMQAETRLPLSADQMGLDWKTIHVSDSERTASVAAMRRNSPPVREAAVLEPDHMILEADALVQMWRWGCGVQETSDAVLMSLCEHYTVLCCVHDRQLIHVSVLDLGLAELAPSDGASTLESGVLDQFVQELQDAMQGYQTESSGCRTLTLMSDASDALGTLRQTLEKAGLAVQEVTPSEAAFSGRIPYTVADLYAWRVPIGLALSVLNESPAHYELFKDLCGCLDKKEVSNVRPILSWFAAAVAICLMTWTLYAVDIRRHKKLAELTSAPQVVQFQKEKAYQKLVARQRANMLELINVVASKEHKGIVLDTFVYKRGQPLKIAGRADKSEPWYDYDKAMTNLKGVSQAKRDNPVPDEKTKKVKFGMSFHYKTFTQKVTQ
ncbi:MAG: hypothetical protein K9N55_19265 [Phycisphaerae bacterium]|nr:hypothetical protein [Phycisphaerae bacterium]